MRARLLKPTHHMTTRQKSAGPGYADRNAVSVLSLTLLTFTPAARKPHSLLLGVSYVHAYVYRRAYCIHTRSIQESASLGSDTRMTGREGVDFSLVLATGTTAGEGANFNKAAQCISTPLVLTLALSTLLITSLFLKGMLW